MKRILIVLLLLMVPVLSFAETVSLSAGSRGEEVRALQLRLEELGLNVGTADGIYGSKTAAAVSEAQQLLLEAGYTIEVSGTADSETILFLFDAKAEDALLTLCSGSRGERVRTMQNRLIDLKLLSGSADGVYGSATEAAVRDFQQKMLSLGAEGIQTDGVASPAVLALLTSDLSEYGFHAPVFFDDAQPLLLEEEDLYAASCILIDAPSGRTLFEKSADAQMYPASTTKIMTLFLALENGLTDRTVVIPQSAADIPADSSKVPVLPGEKMPAEDLLYGLMIRSGNDAANAVAELCSGSVSSFVDQMNTRAAELGMTGTHFTNPHGYHDENHYSTARDLAILTRAGLTDPVFCQIATCLNYTMQPTHRRDTLLLKSTHEIFVPDSPYFISGAAGVKSGFTSHAGFCYVGAAQRGSQTLIAVILNVPGRERGWTDLRRLFEYGFALEE